MKIIATFTLALGIAAVVTKAILRRSKRQDSLIDGRTYLGTINRITAEWATRRGYYLR